MMVEERTELEEWADEWRTTSAYALAREADCGSPDSDESAGARMLYSVRDAVLEACEYRNVATVREVEMLREDGTDHELADAGPDIYTHTRWAEFVDLAAYQEDVSEHDTRDSLTELAGVALYMICERLVAVMLESLEAYLSDSDA